ncbi:MAG: preprotein translocase subunit SecA [Mageeibacillus sp.]|jgi:preprotein translocase subunit SecA|nr:preprotein translocase subunit SecA [Mageeibacillus sp.]MCI1263365.1 preprotein translocase subunit SecA [Saccharofermentans sp.]MCI2043961.1 preprotein translocase subunit SecA [Mageeibacillus sp.]
MGIFGTHSDRELKRIKSQVDKVFMYEEEFSNLTDSELEGKTQEFKNRLEAGETLDMLLPEAFATVREASWRVLGMKPYRVQVIGGIILHQGRIAEMKTGEGKTLVATMPVYLNALTGDGVHVVTVNDYLAKRDSEWMGKIYRFLGMSVGLIIHDVPNKDRQAMYACDIVYGTNNEFGFDYLRDNMVTRKEQIVQRDLNYAIVDEVDSILIDEARTPLIISGRGVESSELYMRADSFVKNLKEYVVVETDDKVDMDDIVGDADYVIDEKAKTSVLTANGIAKAEKFFGVENLSDADNFDLQHYINNALKANGNFKKDQQYIVQEGEVIIVDDFTGRLMPGRRFSDGLHQAIEAKEGVKVASENKTLATITFQNFFRMYNKLSGMTGTAYTEEAEFRQIYNLDVIQIPTNMPVIREDDCDAVFKTENGKYSAILKVVKEANDKGQPVLVGTVNVDRSELLSRIFSKYGIKHNVLNAKNHMREAEIVAQAGRKGAVTIATNMAGRGTDIILGGNSEFLAKQEMRKQGYSDELIEQADAHNETEDEVLLEARSKFAALKADIQEGLNAEAEEVKAAGGLFIVGTERHESRRIDNQLKGRSGRQGDPGRSKFFLSLEDDLLRIFGGDKVTAIADSLGIDESMEIQVKTLARLIDSSQKKLEAMHFSARKNVIEYDDVNNIQRTITYEQRRRIIDGEDVHDIFLNMIEKVAVRVVNNYALDGVVSGSERYALGMQLEDIYGELDIIKLIKKDDEVMPSVDELVATITEQAKGVLAAKEEKISTVIFREAERQIMLRTVDLKWMDHIDALDQLSQSIRMRSIGQHDPVVEYKLEGSAMFDEMNEAIQNDAVKFIMRVQFSEEHRVEAQPTARVTSEGHASEVTARSVSKPIEGTAANSAPAQPVRRDPDKVGRNDLCPCGSGKKYKDCCGRK